jgi:hypothetical protein
VKWARVTTRARCDEVDAAEDVADGAGRRIETKPQAEGRRLRCSGFPRIQTTPITSSNDHTPDFTRPTEPLPTFHCKRCHRNISEAREKHDKVCGGFTSECWPWCSYPLIPSAEAELSRCTPESQQAQGPATSQERLVVPLRPADRPALDLARQTEESPPRDLRIYPCPEGYGFQLTANTPNQRY